MGVCGFSANRKCRKMAGSRGNEHGTINEAIGMSAQAGIEVWSAMEGQQRFDTHVDKLLNYIRYWQASGESIKTSIRVKTRMEQLT